MARQRGGKPAARPGKTGKGPDNEEARQTFRAFAWNLAAALAGRGKAGTRA